MTETPHLALPLIAAAQAQKHVTHNEALFAIDTLLQCAVLDKDLAAPPLSPTDGDRYIVAAGPTGAWVGKAGQIAAWQDGVWNYYAPQPGFIVFVADEGVFYFYGGSGWTSLASAFTALQNLSLLGIGTAADAANPFSAKLNKALWTAKAASEGGSGDLRYTLNKEAAGNVLSLLLQSGYSGRLELGLVGDDDVHVKVSADGSAWQEALRIDRATGGVDFLAAETNLASSTTCDLGSAGSLKINVTGTATITSFGTRANTVRLLRFSGASILTHNATSLVLPGLANITTAAGDSCLAVSDASGNWRIRNYGRATGKTLVGPTSTDISDATATGKAVLTATNAAALATAAGLGTTAAPGFAGISAPSGSLNLPTGTPIGSGASSQSFVVNGLGVPQYGYSFGSGNFAGPGTHLSGYYGVAFYTSAAARWQVLNTGPFAPCFDSQLSIGTAALRTSVIYAATGAINTSDAREKTVVTALTEAEIAAAADLARAIGSFQFLDAVAAKGADAARRHVGMTVQHAIEIMTGHGLDPMRYAFICHDAWEAAPAVPDASAIEAVLGDDGNIVTAAQPAKPAQPETPAGDRYGFRVDELALFMARGQEARLAALEA